MVPFLLPLEPRMALRAGDAPAPMDLLDGDREARPLIEKPPADEVSPGLCGLTGMKDIQDRLLRLPSVAPRGGADQIDVVDFQAGIDALTPTAEKTLQGLTKALTSRPALRMDIEGAADPAADAKGKGGSSKPCPRLRG